MTCSCKGILLFQSLRHAQSISGLMKARLMWSRTGSESVSQARAGKTGHASRSTIGLRTPAFCQQSDETKRFKLCFDCQATGNKEISRQLPLPDPEAPTLNSNTLHPTPTAPSPNPKIPKPQKACTFYIYIKISIDLFVYVYLYLSMYIYIYIFVYLSLSLCMDRYWYILGPLKSAGRQGEHRGLPELLRADLQPVPGRQVDPQHGRVEEGRAREPNLGLIIPYTVVWQNRI